MRVFYTIGIFLYTLGIRIAALFGHKNASLMVKGWRISPGSTQPASESLNRHAQCWRRSAKNIPTTVFS